MRSIIIGFLWHARCCIPIFKEPSQDKKTAGRLRPVSIVGIRAWIDGIQAGRAQEIFTRKRKTLQRVITVLGTRPEVIKLAPVIRELEKRPHAFESIVLSTGQHDELLTQTLDVFAIKPDITLKAMRRNQTLSSLTSRMIRDIDTALKKYRPDTILVQGDTTTVLAASLVAFYNRIAIGHVEAGLRTKDKYRPFPEEINRRLADQMTDFAFAPTEAARRNLLRAGVPERRIFVTGNTVIDALLQVSSADKRETIPGIPPLRERMILITAHRRENFGQPLLNVLHALVDLLLLKPTASRRLSPPVRREGSERSCATNRNMAY
jgi:UDP-N-acetylglucosamine 2-epimerase (non-hydrolysing)